MVEIKTILEHLLTHFLFRYIGLQVTECVVDFVFCSYRSKIRF
jgi:hypothetical protein